MAALVGVPALKPQAASAAVVLPQPVQSTPNGSTSLVLSTSTDPAVINAPHDYVKIYLDANDTGNAFVNIYNAPFAPCNADVTATDWTKPTDSCAGVPATADYQVRYDFWAEDAAEDDAFSTMTHLFTFQGWNGQLVNGSAGTVAVPHNSWSGNIPIPVAKTVVSTVTGYRVVVMEASYADSYCVGTCPGSFTPAQWSSRLHSYRLRTVGATDDLGYWAALPGSPPPDGQYIVHYLGQPNTDLNSEEFDFAPSCSTTTDQDAYLKWYDADNSQDGGGDGTHGAWDLPPSFWFYEIDQNGNQVAAIDVDGNGTTGSPDLTTPVNNIGGNNVYRQLHFVAHPGWKYRWVWHNMNGPFGSAPIGGPANNIQMWLPFDSINYQLSCWNYHSTVGSADGRAPNSTLDFSNPANQTVKFWVDARNIGSRPGPVAHTTPTMSPGGWATLVTTDPADPQVNNGDINAAIGGLASVTSYFGHGAKYEFKFDPLTPTGTYCFGDTIQPHTSTSPIAPSDNTVCYKVKNDRRFPSLVGLNSDVHAGGGLCPTSQNPGNVQGGNGTGGASYGQYVVSAAAVGAVGGMISNFGSGNAAGANKLNIGSSGNYQQICRKDLYAYAEQNKNLADPNQHQLSAGNYVINPSWSGIYYTNGPITISANGGGIQHKITLVVESGDLSISGDVTLSNSFSAPRPDAGRGAEGPPALGIIAGDPAANVFIEPAVRTVDAYIFSDGTIDTCATATVFAPPGCGNMLTVNGFLMAKSINFKRTAPDDTLGAQTGERVAMTPQLYLNPPFYFDAGVDNNPLNGLGEKQPLF